MNESTRTTEFFDTLANVLFRCWIFGYLFLLFWFGIYLAAGQAIYQLHGDWFSLSRHEMDVIFYCGIGLTKVIVLLFFLFHSDSTCLAESEVGLIHLSCEQHEEMME